MASRNAPIMTHWMFQNEDATWTGFSQSLSSSMESAWVAWSQDTGRVNRHPARLHSGHFRYTVNFYDAEVSNGKEASKYQKIRRVSLVEEEAALVCTLEKSAWKEYQEEVKALRAESERGAGELRERDAAQRQRIAELEAEVAELRRSCAAKQQEAERLQRELEAGRFEDNRVRSYLTQPFPGRLVTVAPACGDAAVPAGSLGRVRALRGSAAAVDFPGQGRFGVCLDSKHLELAREAELLSRSGTFVAWIEGDGSRETGVVCDAIDDVTVNVMGSDGRKRPRGIWSLDLDERARSLAEPLEVGDLVGRPGRNSVGMVVRATEDLVCVRFREELPGGRAAEPCSNGKSHVDVVFTEVDAETELQRLDKATRVRPGCAARFKLEAAKAPRTQRQSEVGVVYAVHADGTAVVDFLGNMGCRCGLELLEVADHPRTIDHDVLCLLSECLSYHEAHGQRWEDYRDESVLRFISTLPATLPMDEQDNACQFTEWGPRTDVFQFVAKLLLESVQDSYPPGRDGNVRLDMPLLCVEQVVQMTNPRLQRLYVLHLRHVLEGRSLATGSLATCSRGGAAPDEEEDVLPASGMPLGPTACELFLWRGVPLDALESISRRGFSAGRGARLAFSACASRVEEDLPAGAGGGAGGRRCAVLARVLPDGGAGASGLRRCDHTVRDGSQALPLFQVSYRHLCRGPVPAG